MDTLKISASCRRHFSSPLLSSPPPPPPPGAPHSHLPQPPPPRPSPHNITLSHAVKNAPSTPLDSSLKNLIPSLTPQHVINLINHIPLSLHPLSSPGSSPAAPLPPHPPILLRRDPLALRPPKALASARSHQIRRQSKRKNSAPSVFAAILESGEQNKTKIKFVCKPSSLSLEARSTTTASLQSAAAYDISIASICSTTFRSADRLSTSAGYSSSVDLSVALSTNSHNAVAISRHCLCMGIDMWRELQIFVLVYRLFKLQMAR